MCLDGNRRFVTSSQTEQDRDANEKTLLNMFSKHGVNVLRDLVRESTLSGLFTIVSTHLSVFVQRQVCFRRIRSVSDLLREKKQFTRNWQELRNQAQFLFALEKGRPTR